MFLRYIKFNISVCISFFSSLLSEQGHHVQIARLPLPHCGGEIPMETLSVMLVVSTTNFTGYVTFSNSFLGVSFFPKRGSHMASYICVFCILFVCCSWFACLVMSLNSCMVVFYACRGCVGDIKLSLSMFLIHPILP